MTTRGTRKFEFIKGLPPGASATLGTCGVERSGVAKLIIIAMIMALFALGLYSGDDLPAVFAAVGYWLLVFLDQ